MRLRILQNGFSMQRILFSLLSLNLFLMASSAHGSIPEWAMTPPSATTQFLYGVGTGNDYNSAKQSASASIAGIFESRVSEHYLDAQKLNSGNYDRQTQILTVIHVEDVALNSIDVVRSEAIEDNYYVLARLDLLQFASAARLKIQSGKMQLDKWFSDLPTSSYLYVVSSRQTVATKLNQTESSLFQLAYADPTFDALPQVKQIQTYRMKLRERLQNDVAYYMPSLTSGAVSDMIKTLLAGYGLNIASSMQPNNIPSTTIKTDVYIDQTQDDREANIVNLRVTITSLEDGIQHGKSVYHARGRSYKNNTDAFAKALSSLQVNMQKNSLTELLNVNM